MKPFDFFDAIFCINLDKRPNRWESAQKEFEKIGILDKVKRFSAVEDTKHPERGCFESHLGCIFKAREKKLNNVCIFEDDVVFLPCYSDEKMNNAVEKLKEDEHWQFFYLGGLERRIKPRKRYDFLKSKYDGEFDHKCDYLMQCRSVGWAQSYVVNSNIFDKIWDDYNNNLWDIVNKKYNGKTGGSDKYYQDILKPKSYVCVPSFTSQYDMVSDLTQSRMNKNLRVKK
jgi:hypothetical protein